MIDGFSGDWGLIGAGYREVYMKVLFHRGLNKLNKDKGDMGEET